MRVSFLGRYREVAQLVESSAKQSPPSESAQAFGKVLASISPDSIKSRDNQLLGETVALQNSGRPAKEDDLRARLSPHQLRLDPPVGVPRKIDKVGDGHVNGSKGGVNTPAVVEVRRHPARSSLSELRYSERASVVQEMVQQKGRALGVDPAVGWAVALVESSFNPQAVSRDGHYSKGLFQLLDSTGKELLSNVGKTGYDPFDPEQNVHLGMSYLRRLHDTFSRSTQLSNKMVTSPAANSSSLEKLAVAAFNAGEGRVASAQRRAAKAGRNPGEYEHVAPYLPKITAEYVRRVVNARDSYESRFAG